MKEKQKTSKVASVFTGLYLLALIASVLIMVTTSDDTAMSGIFLVLVSMPWTFMLSGLQDAFALDSMLFNTLFLVAGGLLNGLIIYISISFITNKKKQ